MSVILKDMSGLTFTEGDFVLFADGRKGLHAAKVRGIKTDVGRYKRTRIALELVDVKTGKVNKRYSRDYYEEDFYKLKPSDLTTPAA